MKTAYPKTVLAACFAFIMSHMNGQDDFWIKFGTSLNYSFYNLDNTGLNKDLQGLTGRNDISFRNDMSELSYGSLGLDGGGKHFFVGIKWTFDLEPFGRDYNYYEKVNTNTFAVPDNISVNIQKEQFEGRIGFGRFAPGKSGTPSFFGIGGFLFAGSYTQTLEIDNFTTRDLFYKNIFIKNGSILNSFESRRLVFGIGFTTFVTFGEGATSTGVSIEIRYSHIGSGSWKDQDEKPVSFSKNGFNMLTICFVPYVTYNDF